MIKQKPQIHIVIENEQPVTTSRNVANNFEKRHDNIIRDIEKLLKEDPLNFEEMFKEGAEPDSYGRDQKVYYMNRDGFSFLVMGFTGKKANKFKLAYIDQFNEMERQLQNQLPRTYKEALLQLVEQVEHNEQLELENKEMKPKADYFDLYIANKGVMTIGVIAENYGMSARAMNNLLHELGVQYKQGDTWRLYAKHKKEGYAHIESFDYKDSTGKLQVNPHLKWHPKGHHFIYELLKDNGILPLIEREDSQWIEQPLKLSESYMN